LALELQKAAHETSSLQYASTTWSIAFQMEGQVAGGKPTFKAGSELSGLIMGGPLIHSVPGFLRHLFDHVRDWAS
jgi:hypothetical protein